MSEINKQIVLRLIDEAQRKGNFAVIHELMAEDFVDHSPLPGLPPTREGVAMLFGGMLQAFPDLSITVEEQIADDEKVVSRKTFEGTHQAPFLGMDATGNAIKFEVIDILTIRGGKIREHRVVADLLTLMKQLGAIPA